MKLPSVIIRFLVVAALHATIIASAAPYRPTDTFLAPAERLSFEISPEAVEKLQTDPRSYVRADMRCGDNVVRNIGVRLKGKSTFQTVSSKPSLAVKFDAFVPGQRFRGQNKILLNNSIQDPTYLREYLASSIFIDAGIPAARVTHARIAINQRDLGIYVCTEAVDKQFLSNWFSDANGTLYEGDTKDINFELEQDNGKDVSQKDRRSLVQACSGSVNAQASHDLAGILDIEAFLRFVSIELALQNPDGYVKNRNNYRIYRPSTTGRFVFIPHGLDMILTRPMGLTPHSQSIVIARVYGEPDGRERYWQICSNTVEKVWRVDDLRIRIEHGAKALSSLAVTDQERSAVEAGVSAMMRLVSSRRSQLEATLAWGHVDMPQFGSNACVGLPRWIEQRGRGGVTFGRAGTPQKHFLSIASGDSNSSGAWYSQVYLPPGRYSLHGEAKATLRSPSTFSASYGIRPDVLAEPVSSRTSGEGKGLSCVFDVPVASEVKLFCEFASGIGQVDFDVDTLKLCCLEQRPSASSPGVLGQFRAATVK